MQENLENLVKPKVFVGICTGPSKEYAMHYMVAALRNLDCGNMEIHWAVTDFGNNESTVYLQRLKQLMGTVKWSCPVHIHTTPYDLTRAPTHLRNYGQNKVGEEQYGSYDFVLRNLRLLRGIFLDGDCNYFLEVGGDNPPPRDTVNRLMKLDADAAFGTCYQRPKRDEDKTTYPLVWTYTWSLKDLDQYNLEPVVKEQLALAFTNTPFVVPIYTHNNWREIDYISPYAGGTGIVLIRRAVLERVGWRLPTSLYFSEDLYFCHQCNAHGYKTVGDLKFHCPHFDESGMMF